MRVIVACEFSGVVRGAFRCLGHDAWSADLEAPEDNSPFHLQGDVRRYLNSQCEWDLLIAHPPCTYLASSGARWWIGRKAEQETALQFVCDLLAAPIPKIALENPIGRISTAIRKPDQIIQPWMFGHGETKATCLWLKNLPTLKPTSIVAGRKGVVWRMPPTPTRSKDRSRTYLGIGQAMAEQWGSL